MVRQKKAQLFNRNKDSWKKIKILHVTYVLLIKTGLKEMFSYVRILFTNILQISGKRLHINRISDRQNKSIEKQSSQIEINI